MSKQKLNRIGCGILMVISLGLIFHDVVEDSEYKFGNLATHVGLFLIAVLFLYLNIKNDQKMKKKSRWGRAR